jgi:hypothetical protein
MGPMRATVDGPLVHVTGAAYVFDREPGNAYVWTLRVDRGRRDDLVWEHHYTDQATVLPLGQFHADLKFSDTVALERGRYRVWLYLHSLAPGSTFEGLPPGADFEKTAGYQVFVSANTDVAVAE